MNLITLISDKIMINLCFKQIFEALNCFNLIKVTKFAQTKNITSKLG